MAVTMIVGIGDGGAESAEKAEHRAESKEQRAKSGERRAKGGEQGVRDRRAENGDCRQETRTGASVG